MAPLEPPDDGRVLRRVHRAYIDAIGLRLHRGAWAPQPNRESAARPSGVSVYWDRLATPQQVRDATERGRPEDNAVVGVGAADVRSIRDSVVSLELVRSANDHKVVGEAHCDIHCDDWEEAKTEIRQRLSRAISWEIKL